MLRYFWTYQTDLPASVTGLRLYGPVHLAWLCGTVLVIILMCRWYKELDDSKRDAVSIAIGWTLLALKCFQVTVITIHGHMDVQYLPLHLCEMSLFVYILHSHLKTDFLAQAVYSLCMPGACMALLFPDWTAYPALNYESIYGFVFHVLLVAYPAMQLSVGRIRPDIRKLWKPILFLCIVVPPIYVLDKLWDTNFFFVNWPSPGSPLVALEQWLGNPGYLIGYGALALTFMIIMYLPFAVVRAHGKAVSDSGGKT